MAKQVIKRGSIVLVRYPFTDLSGSKVRPALALTPDELVSQMDDALFLFISSTIPLNLLPADLVFKKRSSRFYTNRSAIGKISRVAPSRTSPRFSDVRNQHQIAPCFGALVLPANVKHIPKDKKHPDYFPDFAKQIFHATILITSKQQKNNGHFKS